ERPADSDDDYDAEVSNPGPPFIYVCSVSTVPANKTDTDRPMKWWESERFERLKELFENSASDRVLIGSPVRNLVANGGGGYWRSTAASRPTSPGAAMADNASETSSMMPAQPVVGSRPKSRADGATSRYSNLSYWRARKVVFYKNGDPFFPGVEFRFKPGRDIGSLESLLDKLSLRMDLPRGARYIFSMDGDRKLRLDELEDGASYVVSSYKAFK
ncbi:Doublecortin-domain-containing echinoderm-microtubule-associated protein, partial [Carabus blaptoides fortunei]